MPDKTPMQARTQTEIEALPSEGFHQDGKWFLGLGKPDVTLSYDQCSVTVQMPWEVWDRMVRWYVTGDPYGKLEVDDDKNV